MANRSYLYASDVSPQQIEQWSEGRQIGISEWNYDIPLVFKLLISGNTQPCRSLLWDELDPIALQGDYQAGVARLAQFLAQITEPALQPDIQQALAFLQAPENQRRYLVLECGEIYSMDEVPMVEQNQQLLHHVQQLDAEIAAALQLFAPQPPVAAPGFFARLFGLKPTQPTQQCSARDQLLRLGLGCWTNHLCYRFDIAPEPHTAEV